MSDKANIKIGEFRKNNVEYIEAQSVDSPGEYLKFKYTPTEHATYKGKISFVDYDATLIEEWTYYQLSSKTELPPNPVHTGSRLVNQGWNWTLAEIKSYMENYPNTILTVGQMYDSLSGKLEIDVELDSTTGLLVEFYDSYQRVSDWGDGTSGSYTHTYTNYGSYTIILDSISSYTVARGKSGMMKAVRIGHTTYIGNYDFNYGVTGARYITFPQGGRYEHGYNIFSEGNGNVKTLIFPRGFIGFNYYSLRGFSGIKYLSIPPSMNKFHEDTFQSCGEVDVAIPDGVTTVGGFISSNVRSINIPNSAISIVAGSFKYANKIRELDLKNIRSIERGGGSEFTSGIGYSAKNLEVVKADKLVTTQSGSSFYGCVGMRYLSVGAYKLCNQTSTCWFVEYLKAASNNGSYSIPETFRIKELILPENLITLTERYGFSVIEYIKIPKTCLTLNSNALRHCGNLRTIDFSDHKSIPTMQSDTISYIYPHFVVIVPDNLYESWKIATNWALYADHIKRKGDL